MTAETRRSAWRLGIASAVLMWSCAFAFTAAEPAAAPIPQAPIRQDQLDFFESRIRPIFVNNCYKCHSSGLSSPSGGLVLDWKGGWEKGGGSGPAIVPGDPTASLLIWRRPVARFGSTVVTTRTADASLPRCWTRRGSAAPMWGAFPWVG